MTNVCRKPEIPIPCPTCKGKGVGTDGKMCWSCKGSYVLMVSETAYARVIGDHEKEERHRLYTPEEEGIVLGPGTLRERIKLLRKKGYMDRTEKSINNKRAKLREEERKKSWSQ